MKDPPRAKSSNVRIGFLTGLIVGPIALIAGTFLLTAKNSETVGLLAIAIVLSPLVGIVVGGMGALLGWFLRSVKASTMLPLSIVLALLTPLGAYKVFTVSNSIRSMRYRQLSMNRADQVERLIGGDFPMIKELKPELEAPWSESLGPGVWYKSSLPYDQLLSTLKSKTGSDWDRIELRGYALFARAKPPAGVSLITVGDDLPGQLPTATFRRTDSRGALFTVAEIFRSRLLEGVRRDPMALLDAFQLLTPKFQSKLRSADSLKSLIPKENAGKLNGTNFGTYSIRMYSATMEVQVGEIRTKTSDGETVDWVMAETNFERTDGLWRVSGLKLNPPSPHSRTKGTLPPQTATPLGGSAVPLPYGPL